MPSRFLWIVAALFIATGVGSLVEMVWGLFHGDMMLNIGFIFIPIGYGLMIGRESSRRWARFWMCVIAVVCAIVLSSLGFGGESFQVAGLILRSKAIILSWWGCGLTLVASVGVFFGLKKSRHGDWFEQEVSDQNMAKRFRLAIAALTVPTVIVSDVIQRSAEEYVRSIYSYDVEIRVFDAQSGLPLESVISSGWTSLNNGQRFSFPKGTSYYPFEQDGVSGTVIGLEGVAVEPFEYTVGSGGYIEQKVIINRDSPDEIRVELEKTKND